MKKLILILLTMLVCLTITACGETTPTNPNTPTEPPSQETPANPSNGTVVTPIQPGGNFEGGGDYGG